MYKSQHSALIFLINIKYRIQNEQLKKISSLKLHNQTNYTYVICVNDLSSDFKIELEKSVNAMLTY